MVNAVHVFTGDHCEFMLSYMNKLLLANQMHNCTGLHPGKERHLL